jgi:NADPH-dependent 7-cyano-7-deazaguanine reductase QueF-like protein
VKDTKIPLGKDSDYPHKYAPEVLYPIARGDSREPLGIAEALPFAGVGWATTATPGLPSPRSGCRPRRRT